VQQTPRLSRRSNAPRSRGTYRKRLPFRPIPRCDGLEVRCGIEVADLRVHRSAGCQVGPRSDTKASVVEVSRVRLVRRHRRLLLNQSAAGVKDISERAFEDAGPHAIEGDCHALSIPGHGCFVRMKLAEECSRTLGGSRRKIEEGVPSAAPLARFKTIERARRFDYRFPSHADLGDQRPP